MHRVGFDPEDGSTAKAREHDGLLAVQEAVRARSAKNLA